MASPTIYCSLEQDKDIWSSIKEAISHSSGFQRWQEENYLDLESDTNVSDEQIRAYLRSTLETLAY